MRPRRKPTAGLLVAAVLLAALSAACAHRPDRSSDNSTTEPATGATTTAATLVIGTAAASGSIVTDPATTPPLASVPPEASETAFVPDSGNRPNPTPVTNPRSATTSPTPDPLDAELRGLNEMLNGIDSSLSGAATAGGE